MFSATAHYFSKYQMEKEWFTYAFVFNFDIEEIRGKIASGEITPRPAEYSAKFILEKFYQPDEDLYGSGSFETPEFKSFDPFTALPVTLSKIPDIPEDKINEPPLFVMWRPEAAAAIIDHKEPSSDREGAIMIDGHHRLTKRYVMGDDTPVKCWFVGFEDILEHCYVRGKSLQEYIDFNK